MIEKPCFYFNGEIECDGPLRGMCIGDWENCSSGKLHPFYTNWLKMTEQPAADPWNFDLSACDSTKQLIWLVESDGGRQGRYVTSESYDLPEEDKIIAWAEVHTGGEK